MSPQEDGRGSFFGNGRGRNGWLVPLLVGLGIGALLFGLLPGLHWGPGDRQPDRYGRDNTGGLFQQQPAPRADRGTAAPQGRFEHGHGRAPSGHDWWLPGALFFPFGASRLILPLLLIGSGAWLLTRRRGGWGGSAYPPQGSPPAPPAPPADPEPRSEPEPRLPARHGG